MSATWNWPGSRWWRVDLHTHSPASYDFGSELDRNAKDWPAWIAAGVAAGLDAVALTDHNTPAGVEEIKRAAAGSSLAIFPGVEATVGGVHLLCLFDPSANRDDVVALLSKLGIEPAAFGTAEASATKGIAETIHIATAAGALVIAAHVNGPKGLLTMPAGQDRLQALKCPGLLAVEISPIPSQPEGWLDPDGADVQEWLDGRKIDGKRLPQLWCSDSHGLHLAGRRFTWVKMTRPDAEGLRLALLDGGGSLRTATASNPGDPNAHADCAIESISIRHAKYMGRTKGAPLIVAFNPWLNAIIGGRGTGKSTLVDLCRLALRREGELDHSPELRGAFDKRMKVPGSRQEEGLLTADVLVEVTYRKDGERFVLSWDPHRSTISRVIDGARLSEQGDIRERFPVRIYSQKQLFDLARKPDALLAVIDDSPSVRGAELARLRAEAEASYLSLRAEVRALRSQVAELPIREASLADVRRKLDVLERGGHAEALNEYRIRRAQDRAWEKIQRSTAEALAEVERTSEVRLAVPGIEFEAGAPLGPAAALARANSQLKAVVTGLQMTVSTAVQRARIDADCVWSGQDAQEWRAAVAESEREYQAVTERLAQAGIANPEEYRVLVERAASLDAEIAALTHRRTIADEREKEAAAALSRYREARGELTARRTAFAEANSGTLIKVQIRPYSTREGLELALRDALGIARFEQDYLALLDVIAPEDNGEWSFDRLDECVVRLRSTLSDPQTRWDTKDKRFESALRSLHPERLDRLALILPGDSVEVSFREPYEGVSAWRPLGQGSPGQQTAALLAFVLGYGQEPIILDQPEDDLDNTLIYNLVVRRLRDIKPTRQVIVVTHNPNIVVHGDAELLVSLESRGGQTQLAFSGGLQEQKGRDQVCLVMEGGPEAFETRYQRIVARSARRD